MVPTIPSFDTATVQTPLAARPRGAGAAGAPAPGGQFAFLLALCSGDAAPAGPAAEEPKPAESLNTDRLGKDELKQDPLRQDALKQGALKPDALKKAALKKDEPGKAEDCGAGWCVPVAAIPLPVTIAAQPGPRAVESTVVAAAGLPAGEAADERAEAGGCTMPPDTEKDGRADWPAVAIMPAEALAPGDAPVEAKAPAGRGESGPAQARAAAGGPRPAGPGVAAPPPPAVEVSRAPVAETAFRLRMTEKGEDDREAGGAPLRPPAMAPRDGVKAPPAPVQAGPEEAEHAGAAKRNSKAAEDGKTPVERPRAANAREAGGDPQPVRPARAPAAAVAASQPVKLKEESVRGFAQAASQVAQDRASASASPARQASAAPDVAAVEPAAEPAAASPGPAAREIALRLPDTPERVEIRMAERAGEIRVSVHSPDAGLRGAMQERLAELVSGLDKKGFAAEAWKPAVAASSPGSEAGMRGDRQSDSNWSGPAPDGGQSGRRDHRSPGRQPDQDGEFSLHPNGEDTSERSDSWLTP